MGIVLDSSVLIEAERGNFDLEAIILSEASSEPIYLASITASELLHGVHRASPKHAAKRSAFVEHILASTPVLAFDLASARQHAKIWAQVSAQGKMIRAHDLLIAATCLRYGFGLSTLNETEFERVEGLELARTRAYLSSENEAY